MRQLNHHGGQTATRRPLRATGGGDSPRYVAGKHSPNNTCPLRESPHLAHIIETGTDSYRLRTTQDRNTARWPQPATTLRYETHAKWGPIKLTLPRMGVQGVDGERIWVQFPVLKSIAQMSGVASDQKLPPTPLMRISRWLIGSPTMAAKKGRCPVSASLGAS